MVSARITEWAGSSAIEHFAISATLPHVGEWMTPAPAVGDVVTWTGPGHEGTPIGFVALHASGAASGCYMGGANGRCGCSIPRRAAGQCRFEVAASRPDGGVDSGVDASTVDVGSLPDGGMEDAGKPF